MNRPPSKHKSYFINVEIEIFLRKKFNFLEFVSFVPFEIAFYGTHSRNMFYSKDGVKALLVLGR
jgi:hypothetical protein